MAESDVLSYVGAIGGVIGTVSGVAGAIIAYFSYKKTEQLKVLNLRLELGKLVVGLIEEYDELPRLVDRAKKSRTAIASASGLLNSGTMQQWTKQLEADEKSLESLYGAVEELNVNHAISTTKELEEALVTAHLLQTTGKRIRQSYERSLEEDEKRRDLLRTAAQERVAGAGAKQR